MALIGGGGAGNVAGGNPSGTGSGLNYIGNHAYAYNSLPATADDTVILRFNTGAEYILGWIQFNGYIKPNQPSVGTEGSCTVTFDDQTVLSLKTDTELETSAPHSENQYILIPAFTNVVVTLRASQASADQFATVGFAGRLYA